MGEKVIDLTREEGARILEKELFLYSIVERIKRKFEKVLNSKEDKVEEFYSTNFFIDGKRGTGKTSVLLTLKEELKEKKEIELLETINLSVNQKGILLYLLSHIKSKIENFSDSDKECRTTERFLAIMKDSCIYDLLSKVMAGYPQFLKCFQEETFKKICETEMEELLDSLEGDFLRNFKELIKVYKEIYGKDIVIVLDDVDLVQNGELLYKTFVELAVFLSIEHIHVIAAGDLDNTYKILESAIKKQSSDNDKTAEIIAQSFIDKVFPLPNRFRLKPLAITDLINLKLRVKENKNDKIEPTRKTELLDFLCQHPTFEILRRQNENLIYYLFEDLPLREFIQILRSINEKIDLLRNLGDQGLTIEDLVVSNVFSKFAFLDYYSELEFPTGGPKFTVVLEKEEDKKVLKPVEVKFSKTEGEEDFDQFITDLTKYNEELGRKFLTALLLFSEKNERFRHIFKIEKLVDLKDGRKLSLFHALNIIDRRFYALLTLWLTEVLNYTAGVLFFSPYFLITLSMLYGLPNIFLVIEGRISKVSKEQELPYGNPLEELSYIDNFVDVENLLFILDSLDADKGLKIHKVTKEIMKSFLFHQNVPPYIRKQGRHWPRVILHYYKFWFLPYFAVIIGKSKDDNKAKDFLYEKFATFYGEEVEESEEITDELLKEFTEALQETYEKLKSALKVYTLDFRDKRDKESFISKILIIDRDIFSYSKSLIIAFVKHKIKSEAFYKIIRIFLYHFLSLLFMASIYNSEYSWFGREVLDTLERLSLKEGGKLERTLSELLSIFLENPSSRKDLSKVVEDLIKSLDELDCSSANTKQVFKLITLHYLLYSLNWKQLFKSMRKQQSKTEENETKEETQNSKSKKINENIEEIENNIHKLKTKLETCLSELSKRGPIPERDKAFLEILAYPVWAFKEETQ